MAYKYKIKYSKIHEKILKKLQKLQDYIYFNIVSMKIMLATYARNSNFLWLKQYIP